MANRLEKMECILLILLLTPTPNIRGGKYIPVFIMMIYSGVLTYKYITIEKMKNRISNSSILKLILAYLIWELFLLIIQPLSVSNISYTIRPVYFLCIYFSTSTLIELGNTKDLRVNLTKVVKVVILIQVIIVVLQLFDINFLSFLFPDDKAHPLGRLVRVTGTFGNPNVFSWYVTQMILLVVLLENKIGIKVYYLFLGFIMVLLSGSRTMLVIAPFIWIITYSIYIYINENKSRKIFLVTFLSIIIVSFLSILILKLTKDFFPYASQLLNIFKGGLSKVNSFKLRIVKWEETLHYISKNPLTLFFGFKLSTYSSIDNDFLYGLSRSGLIGICLQYLIYAKVCLYILNRNSKFEIHTYMSVLIIQYIFFSFIVGFQAETLAGWIYPPLVFFYMGLVEGEV